MALSGNSWENLREPPAWNCIRSVAELQPWVVRASAHAKTLSIAGFREDVQHAADWSFMRAAKNRLREVVRRVAEDQDAFFYGQNAPAAHFMPSLGRSTSLPAGAGVSF